MIKYAVVSVVSGILFWNHGWVDSSEPVSQKLNEIYKPIAKTSINMGAGIVIDLLYGFLLAGIFLLLFKSLPGETGIVKGISFAILTFFCVFLCPSLPRG